MFHRMNSGVGPIWIDTQFFQELGSSFVDSDSMSLT
jgi:hypothetical protein